MLYFLVFACIFGLISCDFGCRCVFKRNVTMKEKQAALDYVCGAGIDCAAINKGGNDYYPISGSAHHDWAINAYFQEHREDPDNSCDFSGTARVLCETCDCVLKKNSSEADLMAMKKSICYFMNCQPIDDPEGAHYLPNTLEDHTNWAVTAFYKAHDYTTEACKGKIVTLVPEECYP